MPLGITYGRRPAPRTATTPPPVPGSARRTNDPPCGFAVFTAMGPSHPSPSVTRVRIIRPTDASDGVLHTGPVTAWSRLGAPAAAVRRAEGSEGGAPAACSLRGGVQVCRGRPLVVAGCAPRQFAIRADDRRGFERQLAGGRPRQRKCRSGLGLLLIPKGRQGITDARFPPMHPAGLRCSMLTCARYTRILRLACGRLGT